MGNKYQGDGMDQERMDQAYGYQTSPKGRGGFNKKGAYDNRKRGGQWQEKNAQGEYVHSCAIRIFNFLIL